MKVIRASEIGTYQFCHRAWWYQLQGYKPDNEAELAMGKQLHQRHFYRVTGAGCLQSLAYALLGLAILSAAIFLIQMKF